MTLKKKPGHADHSISKIDIEGINSFKNRLLGKDAKNILVINDEGHHAWRPSDYQIKAAREEQKAAGIWTAGLDLLHNACKISQCFDFSATPFVSDGKGAHKDTLFSWIISDFSLSDSMESGLVKTPITAYTDETRSKDFGNIYRDEKVTKALKHGKIDSMVIQAYQALSHNWKQKLTEWKKSGEKRPPVMITVCNSTNQAKTIMDNMKINKMLIDEKLCMPDALLQIDSGVIKQLEKENLKDDEIREKVSNVGKIGTSGEKVCNIVSVNMLTEGWDAKTVTHIMGLRTFGSQLLCEQVMGRGLRRKSYDIGADGFYTPEYVTIIGVPFGLIPFEETVDGPQPLPPKEISINDSNHQHQISWPVIYEEPASLVSYSWEFDKFRSFKLSDKIPETISLAVIPDGIPIKIEQRLLLSPLHSQTVAFAILQSMFVMGLRETWLTHTNNMANAAPYNDVIELLDIIGKFLKTGIKSELTGNDLMLAIGNQREKIAAHLMECLKEKTKEYQHAKFTGTKSTLDFKPRFTHSEKIYKDPAKSHLNLITGANDFELKIAKALDNSPRVLSWIKADMVGFHIHYDDSENYTREYRPDFIIHLDNGMQLILEGKGEKRDSIAKQKAAEKWVNAVNQSGKYGIWKYEMLFNGERWQQDLHFILESGGSYMVDNACLKCAQITNTNNEAAKLFGLSNNDGILRPHQICKECRND